MLVDTYAVDHQRLLPAELEEKLRGWVAGCAGGVLCFASALGWLSLLTWSVNDPSLTLHRLGPTSNLLGQPGAILSDLMLQMLGFAAVFSLFAVAVWGVELVSTQRISQFRLKALLLPASMIALATGCSALPIAANWPLHCGFGGLLGDFLYNASAGLLGAAFGVRSGAVVGFAFFSGGLATFVYCLGLTGEMLGRWPSLRAQERARSALSGLNGARRGQKGRREGATEPALGPVQAPATAGVPSAADTDAGRREPEFKSWTYQPDDAASPSPAGAMASVPDADEPVARDQEFDLSTDVESRAIAERFAPANAQRPIGPHPARKLRAAAEPVADIDTTPAVAPRLPLPPRPSEPGFRRPSLQLLQRPAAGRPGPEFTQTVLRGTARLLEDVLADFGVRGEIKDIKPGPVVTLFEIEPARGTKAARVLALSEDIARSMSAAAARVAVLPGRNAIGIELPNARREVVGLRELLESETFRSTDAVLPLVLGKSIGGEPVITDLARMPHLLVAGTTGSGKSVGINAMVLSLLYKLSPSECRFLMIDPKMLELSAYNGIPHLLCPVVTDPEKAVTALNWAVREMEERYKRMARLGVRSIEIFNNRVRNAKARGNSLQRTVQTGFDRKTGDAIYESEVLALEPMPYLVIVIDEFADLMIAAGKEIEASVQRLAQMARAAGMHIVMATQRPSVDVVTGTIKANFPTRIAYKVASKVDSRTVMGEQGAEQLLGQGDMLFAPGGGQLMRVHGALVSDEEVETVAAHLRSQGEPAYIEEIAETAATPKNRAAGEVRDDDELYDKAVALVLRERKASTSYVQRRLAIGYNRAAGLIDRMERDGIVDPPAASGRREVTASAASTLPGAA